LLRLLLDQLLELRRPAAAVVGLDAGAAAVVARSAGRDEVRRLPEQLRLLRARDLVMDGRGVAPTTGPADHALVTIAGEHSLAEPLPSRGRVPAVAHRAEDCLAVADGVQIQTCSVSTSASDYGIRPRSRALVAASTARRGGTHDSYLTPPLGRAASSDAAASRSRCLARKRWLDPTRANLLRRGRAPGAVSCERDVGGA
jgi:hypothetical protein